MRLTVDDIAKALAPPAPNNGGARGLASSPAPPLLGAGGPLPTFPAISTDTRTIQAGDLFIALVSPKADGHDFIAQALQAGAAGLVVSQSVDAPVDVPVFQVPDTQVAYGQIARVWRDKFDIPVIGVTGSVGKTTTKEMLAAVLSPLGPVLKTAASQNNETGVPKALLQLDNSHRAAVIEMGMRGAGQIAYLCEVARPTVGVITLIGENHVELLGSQDAIAEAKGELLEALPETGTAVLNAADPYLPRLQAKTAARVATFGVGADADYRAQNVTRTDDGWHFSVCGVSVEIGSPSRHDIGNALAALTVADVLGVPLAEAAEALRSYAPPPMRMQVVQTPWGGTILNDAYNAAPASVRSALETLAARPAGRRIAFLGDMKELGEYGETAHRELGGIIASLGGLDAVYAVGPLAAQIPGATDTFADSAAAARFAAQSLDARPGDTILVKGSRAMAMERIVDALQARKSPEAPPAPNSGGAGGLSSSSLDRGRSNGTLAPPLLGAGGPPKDNAHER